MISRSTLEAAREGRNQSCIDCGDKTFSGGMRCWRCFKRRAVERSQGKHGCPRHEPSLVCYNQCACRCEACSAIEQGRRRK